MLSVGLGYVRMKRGFDVRRDKSRNRSITCTRKERDRLGLRGLLPHRVSTARQMAKRPRHVWRGVASMLYQP